MSDRLARLSSPLLRSLVASGGFGLIAFWASENLFWAAPTDQTTVPDLALTALAYSIAVAAALGGVIWSGLGGWRALFLGGAILGWLSEGVLVSTAYDAFPFQMVWTPLAWHALITGLAVGGIGRAGPRWPLWRQLAALVALGVFCGSFAQFWPLERGAMPGFAAVAVYLIGVSLVVPAANMVLDRIETPTTITWAYKIAWGLALLLWVVQGLFAPSVVRLAVPLAIAITLWSMRRLARADPQPSPARLPPAPLWRHGLFLTAPLLTTIIAEIGWTGVGGIEVWPFALVLSVGGGGLWLWLVGRAVWLSARRSRLPGT